MSGEIYVDEVTAHRLKMLMRERNWGVKAFANRIPADKNSVKTWLAGQYYPRYDSLVKVCELLDVSADYVVGLSDGRGSGGRLSVPLNRLKFNYILRVKELLESKGVSEEKYAEMMGVKAATVENWFSGKKFPEMALVVRSARELNCSLDYLLSRKERPD
ncbi:MAG: helix-turn-helix domain-containing protein [Christensenellales bacterium]